MHLSVKQPEIGVTDFSDQVKEFLIEVYDRLPASMQTYTEPVIRGLKTLMLLFSELKVEAFKVQFELRDKDSPFTVLFVGKEGQLPLLKRLIGTPIRDISREARLFPWEVNAYLKRREMEMDAIVIYLNKVYFSYLCREGYIRMPESVKSILPLEGSLRDVTKTFRTSAFRKYRNVLKAGYTHEVSRDISALRHFYYEMYVPYMKERFKECAVIYNYYKVRRLFRTGCLLRVRKEDKFVSAAVCRIRKSTFIFELIGIEQGNSQLVSKGALDALYYFTILAALEQGCKRIDFGHSPPFLNDGLVQYKRKWGTFLVPNQNQMRKIGVKLRAGNNAECHFLSNRYPVLIDKKGLSGIIFSDNSEPMDLTKMKHITNAYLTPGVNNLLIVSSGFDEAVQRQSFNDFSNRIKLVQLPFHEWDTKNIFGEI